MRSDQGNRIRCRMYIGTCALLRIEFSEFRLKVTWLRIVEQISPITSNVNARLVVSLLDDSSFASGLRQANLAVCQRTMKHIFQNYPTNLFTFYLRGVQTLRSRYVKTILQVSRVSTMFAFKTIKWLLVTIDVF